MKNLCFWKAIETEFLEFHVEPFSAPGSQSMNSAHALMFYLFIQYQYQYPYQYHYIYECF